MSSNCIYDNAVSAGIGSGWGGYVMRMGYYHPVAQIVDQQAVTFEGALPTFMTTTATAFTLRSWTSQRDYILEGLWNDMHVDRGFECVKSYSLPPPQIDDIMEAGRRVGIDMTFDVVNPFDDFAVRLRVQSHGEHFEEAAVEVTTDVTNRAPTPRLIGLRHAGSVGIGGILSGGAWFGAATTGPPSEPYYGGEDIYESAEVPDHFILSSRERPSLGVPYLSGLSARGPWPLVPPPTPPDRVVPSAGVVGTGMPDNRIGIRSTCFQWSVADVLPPRAPLVTGGVQGLGYYWGDTPETAIELGPGETKRITFWVWAFRENPVTCEAGAPQVVECGGATTLATLDGTGAHTEGGNELLHRWTTDDPAVEIVDPSSPTPAVVVGGLGTHVVTHDVGIGPYTGSCTTTIEVVDTTAPSLTVPAPVAVLTSGLPPGACQATVGIVAGAVDLCGAADVTHVTIPDVGTGGADATRAYPLGTTRVVFTAMDQAGNASTAETTVTVVDDRAPTLAPPTAFPSALWPPNHRLVGVSIDLEAADDCDASPSIELVSATSSEHDNGRGDGNTRGDVREADLGTDDRHVLLRAERNGPGRGREYVLTYRALDDAGNASEPVTVTVPVAHDQRARR